MSGSEEEDRACVTFLTSLRHTFRRRLAEKCVTHTHTYIKMLKSNKIK